MYGEFGYGGIAVGDVNNDGLLDVGYGMHHNVNESDFGDEMFEVSLGDGTGLLWTPWDDGLSELQGAEDWWGKFCTDFGDVNNDGLLDIVGNSFGSGSGVHVYTNNGDGTWSLSLDEQNPWWNSGQVCEFGDINNDGNLDLVAAHGSANVFFGDGEGNWEMPENNLPDMPDYYAWNA